MHFLSVTAVLLALLISGACVLHGYHPAGWITQASLLDEHAVRESSGLVRSRRWEGIFWTHNDSGDRPRLFAIGPRGERIARVEVLGAAHVDWEDLTADDAGHLYLCDIGNNSRRRSILVIYQIREVDPRVARKTMVTGRLSFRYPPPRSPDAEACFFAEGAIFLLTKVPGELRTTLYRIPWSTSPDAVLAVGVGEIRLDSPVTGADLRPDGTVLAVRSYGFIDLFDRPPEGVNYLAGRRERIPLFFGQSEAIAWDGTDLLISNEAGGLLRLRRVKPDPPGSGEPLAPALSFG